jgi:hypothetical protein
VIYRRRDRQPQTMWETYTGINDNTKTIKNMQWQRKGKLHHSSHLVLLVI